MLRSLVCRDCSRLFCIIDSSLGLLHSNVHRPQTRTIGLYSSLYTAPSPLPLPRCWRRSARMRRLILGHRLPVVVRRTSMQCAVARGRQQRGRGRWKGSRPSGQLTHPMAPVCAGTSTRRNSDNNKCSHCSRLETPPLYTADVDDESNQIKSERIVTIIRRAATAFCAQTMSAISGRARPQPPCLWRHYRRHVFLIVRVCLSISLSVHIDTLTEK